MAIYLKYLLFACFFILLASCSNPNPIDIKISKYPDGKDFAFTITEDPDYSEMEDRIIMYDFIEGLGLKTTIAVWVLPNKHGSGAKGGLTNTRGLTTENVQYLERLQELQKKGFEISLHTVGPGNDLREDTIEGYEIFKKHFGQYPKININHANNLENIYWGKDRFSSSVLRFLYGFRKKSFEGHITGSKYFWGDICKKQTKYVRAWVTDNINTISVNKTMPYHNFDKPSVNWWFGCSDGADSNKFNDLISDKNIKKLVSERGTSIIYTHFFYNFLDKDNKINEYFRKQMTKISKLDGWFVPASTILDRLLLLRNVSINNSSSSIKILNANADVIEGFTILTTKKKLFFYNTGEWINANNQGEIIIGDLMPYSLIELGVTSKRNAFVSSGFLETNKMIYDWFKSRR